MDWSEFKGKKVGLLGAGVENLALIPYLQQAGADVTVCERFEEAPAVARLKAQNVNLILGENHLDGLDQFDIVFRIAGMPTSRLAQALEKVEHRPRVTSPINLFISMAPGHVIGVTGTKGKGTTSTMIASLLSQVSAQVFVGGNINNAVFGFFDQLTSESFTVLELSSFQLEDVTASPQVAVVLPITPDHLQPLSAINPNYHSSFEDYAKAKANIAAFQQPSDILVYAVDSEPVQQIASPSIARKIGVGFSAEADLRVDEQGRLYEGGQMILDLQETGLKGKHIFLDAALAIAVAREYGVTKEQIITGLKDYKPLPHRMEVVGTVGGVTFVNDSYATAPEAAEAAITAYDNPILWIAGGSTKGADFTALAEAVSQSTVRKAFLLGEEAPNIAEALARHAPKIQVEKVGSLKNAVEKAFDAASAGDTILLSPACASKDMFKDAAERGNQFAQIALKLEAKN